MTNEFYKVNIHEAPEDLKRKSFSVQERTAAYVARSMPFIIFWVTVGLLALGVFRCGPHGKEFIVRFSGTRSCC